ncbi:MAG: GNAT family N-acetyltransferase [Pseudomonadota bacterium]|nr:GNAT family N-acetyltransferase [Pseudomonadota bacterium]
MNGAIVIGREDPRQPEVVRLVHELDEMFHRLYPAESNHLLDVELLAEPDIHFFVVRRGGEAVGTGALWRRDADYGEVKRIYIRPEARGLRLGRAILRELEEDARRSALPLLRLETGIYQPEALGLFLAEGFVRCAAFADYSAHDPFSIFMEKRLV